MPTRSVIAAIISIRPSRAGHFSASTPHTRHSSRAHSMRARFVGAARRPPTPSRSVAVTSAPSPTSAAPGGNGTTATRHGELGASTPW